MRDQAKIERPDISEALSQVRSRIAAACLAAGRRPDEVSLIGASKTIPLEMIREARAAGLAHFAENYANELAVKAPMVPAVWHFVGKLQYGTAAKVADHAQVIHSAEPGRAMDRVSRRAAREGKRIRCLVQVDFTSRRQGVDPDRLGAALASLGGLPGVRIEGLMTLPPWSKDSEASRRWFASLRELRDRLRESWPALTELSMGMSADYEVAVQEGATMVRVGAALFGPRPPGRVPGPGGSSEERGLRQ